MTSAAVGTAVMFTMAMLLVVMAASYVGIEFQRTIEQILDGFIGTACNAAIEVNRSGRQGLLGSATDAAGNDGIDFLGLQETDQGTVALTLMSVEKPVISGACVHLGTLAEVKTDGAAKILVESVPITDARLRQAWPDTLYRTRVYFCGTVSVEVR